MRHGSCCYLIVNMKYVLLLQKDDPTQAGVGMCILFMHYRVYHVLEHLHVFFFFTVMSCTVGDFAYMYTFCLSHCQLVFFI